MFTTKNIGFTLAEVLITLGIIGIVAAMTIPTVVNKYKKQVTVAHIKKFYTTMNQALRRSEADNGEYKFWPIGKDYGNEAYFNKYWAPYLKGFRICKTYKECNYNLPNPFTFLNGTKSNAQVVSLNARTTFMLPDSTVVINFITMGGSEEEVEEEDIAKSILYIDINGGKAPNIFGKDVFVFYRDNKGLIQPYGVNKSDNELKDSCSKNDEGITCSAKIIKIQYGK